MKLAYSTYTLVQQGSRQAKEGALLRVEVGKDCFGYADISPCVSHGDVPLKDQLKLLSKRETTNITAQSLFFAKYDALARKEKVDLFRKANIPQSNILIMNDSQSIADALQTGLQVKVKLDTNWQERIGKIRSFLSSASIAPKLLRFDFSEKLTHDGFTEFLKSNYDLLPYVDYFEDPYPFDSLLWEQTRRTHSIRLGCDQQAHEGIKYPNSCDVLVIKPANQFINENIFHKAGKRQVIFTSYLDHPIGQLCAAYVAAGGLHTFPHQVPTCGLTTHLIYEPTPFTRRLQVDDGYLKPSKKGYGWGFDDLLQGQTWVLV